MTGEESIEFTERGFITEYNRAYGPDDEHHYVSSCSACGALVVAWADEGRHQAWHERVGR